MIDPRKLKELKFEAWAKRPLVKAGRFLQFLYYFFFPPTDRIWPDGASGTDSSGRVFHKHYTFRNFAVHWFNALTDNTQEAKERWKLLIGYEPRYGWRIGGVVFCGV